VDIVSIAKITTSKESDTTPANIAVTHNARDWYSFAG